ncbi:MAG TPA: endolytic transglycosylase MltG [Deltaproteobacteria bacterium]|nr:endolytic transglycosylase MltG [Deltaproteobacteria bacterium]
MKRRLEKALWVAAAASVAAAVHLYAVFFTPASRHAEPKTVVIPKGASSRLVAASLEKAGVVRDADDFLLVAGLMGAHKRIRAGEYELTTAMTPLEVLQSLTRGLSKQYTVTFPEGYNIRQMAALLEAKGLADREEFMARATDRELARSLGIDADGLEGYLFPDTYKFTRAMSVDDMIAAMVARFREVYSGEFERLQEERGMTLKEVVTLASIIEKETAVPEERRRISAVFHNRLRRGIRLESDPTVIYAIEDFDGNLTRKHLRTPTPYNTYVNYGLPAGPIANPGRASIEAALNPTDEKYLYFVSRNDGTHYFSKSLAEHNRAVYKYQKLRKRGR